MKPKKLLCFLTLCMVLTLLATPICATETTEHTANQCGETATWSYTCGVLTISGQGRMDDFPNGAPWQEYSSQITRVVFSGSITYIGAYSFRDYDSLTSVSFGSALYEIGKEAFAFCDGLTAIYLPASFKVFGESSFQNCKNLTEIHCEGRFPTFRQNSMWDTYATIYYPAQNPWALEYIDQLENAFHGRIQFLASDGTDPHASDTATETESTETEPTETEPTETEPTETEPTETEPTETASQQTETDPSRPASQPSFPAPSVPQTVPSQPLDSSSDKDDTRQLILTVTLVIAATFTALAILMLSIPHKKKRRKKGRFSR